MELFTFIKQSIFNPVNVGTAMPCSKYAARKMVSDIDFSKSKYIVEYGPGTGVFTEELIKKCNDDTVILTIEINEPFSKLLKKKYGHIENLHIVQGSAENIDEYMKEFDMPRIDYIVSALPYTCLPENVSNTILNKSIQLLDKNGKFSTIQYSKAKHKYFKTFFNKIDVKRVIRNIPPTYIFCCNNVEEAKSEKKAS
ncbi:MAG: class I SAM-dependent methyltransferase [Candidatus Muiribacteriota bacterium]